MDRTTLFEQIAAEFQLFEDITERWAGKWAEAKSEDRKVWSMLIRTLKERIQLYDDLIELDKRALEFVRTKVESADPEDPVGIARAEHDPRAFHLRTNPGPSAQL